MTQRTLLIAGIALMAAGLLVGGVGGVLADQYGNEAFHSAPGPGDQEGDGPGSKVVPLNPGERPGFPGGQIPRRHPGFPGVLPSPSPRATPNA